MGIPVGGSKKDRQTKLKNRMKGDLAYHVLTDKEKREGHDVFEEKYGKKSDKLWMNTVDKTGSVKKADEAVSDYAARIQKHEGIEMKKGGRVKRKNTSRENRLEELGRVDSEKAYSRKGKRNLKSEKKRIVRELKSTGGSAGAVMSGKKVGIQIR